MPHTFSYIISFICSAFYFDTLAMMSLDTFHLLSTLFFSSFFAYAYDYVQIFVKRVLFFLYFLSCIKKKSAKKEVEARGWNFFKFVSTPLTFTLPLDFSWRPWNLISPLSLERRGRSPDFLLCDPNAQYQFARDSLSAYVYIYIFFNTLFF